VLSAPAVAILPLAHPLVAAAVAAHTDPRRTAAERLGATLGLNLAVICGDREQAEGAHLEDAAERFVVFAQTVDLGDHRSPGARVEAADGRGVDFGEVLGREPVAPRRADPGDLEHVREDAHPERTKEGLGDRAARHPRGGLAGACALQNVAHVGEPVFLCTHQVGVAGTRQVHLGHGGVHRPGAHALGPVGVIAVLHGQRDWAAQRAPMTDAARDVHPVALDLHPAAAPVTQLPASQIAVDRLSLEREAGGHSLQDAREARPVRLPGGDQAEAHFEVGYGCWVSAGPASCALWPGWKRPLPSHQGNFTSCCSPPSELVSLPVPRHGRHAPRSSLAASPALTV